MLKATFNLTTIPFTKGIDTNSLFMSKQFKELIRRMNMLIEQRGIGLFSGEVGCGKTTAIRASMNTLSKQSHKTVYLHRDCDNLGSFYKQIALQLGIMPRFNRSEVATQVITNINELFTQQKITTVIALDEAHLLKPDILDEIRLIHNNRYDSNDYLATIIVGQTPLKKMIEFNKFLPLKQRLMVRYHLKSLSKNDAYDYFEHQLKVAKVTTRIFMDNAIETIITVAKGIPRVINTLAFKAMNLACENKMTMVDQECVLNILDELAIK
jgi:type II secretory pathway predicted ATPase ExeA